MNRQTINNLFRKRLSVLEHNNQMIKIIKWLNIINLEFN
jgi:hypothetical protein